MPKRTARENTLHVYKRLYQINAGFERVARGLRRLDRTGIFNRGELSRFRALSAETRAAINSYLASVIESQETDEAGRLSRQRLIRERQEAE